MLRRQQLLAEIIKIHKESRGNYGSPRITRELRKKGIVVNKKTVAEIMKENGIQAKHKKKFKATTDSNHNLPVAKNHLKRNFKAKKPNHAWVSDITYLRTEEGWLYLAAFIDLFSRKVVGWSMSERMTADLVVNAFRMALFRQKRKAPNLVHSDRGSQYASDAFRKELNAHRCKQSMSRKGDCWDNAVAESFFGTLKTELVHNEKYKTREDARLSVFDYIETFYNRRRLHSYLNYLSPEEFEKSMETA
jgi:transposase InsO family protein